VFTVSVDTLPAGFVVAASDGVVFGSVSEATSAAPSESEVHPTITTADRARKVRREICTRRVWHAPLASPFSVARQAFEARRDVAGHKRYGAADGR
jgi:hypothetical protein